MQASRTPAPTLKPIPTRTRAPTRTTFPSPTYPPVEPGPFQHVAALAESFRHDYEEALVRPLADGSVWVILSQSVVRWDGQAWLPVASLEEDTLADVDESGRLWLFRQDADEIAAWQDGQWTSYGAESGWTSAHVSTAAGWAPRPWRVSTAKDGTVWLPTRLDVRHFDGRRWTIYTLEQMGFPLPEWENNDLVHQIALVEGGAQVWVGGCEYSGPGPAGNPGVRWFDGAAWHGADAPLNPACASVVDLDGAGNVWIGAKNAVWRYQPAGQTWTPYRLPDALLEGFNFTYTRDLIVDQSGDIWVILQYCGGASCDTLSRLFYIHAGEWAQISEMREWGVTPFNRLALDGAGQGWWFRDGTIYRLMGGEAAPAGALVIRGMGLSPAGSLWVLAEHGDEAALWVLEH